MESWSIAEVQQRMDAGTLTAAALTDAYLARIADLDRDGPRLNSVIELNPEARAQALVLDAEREERGARGPLHGVPVLLKENIDTADQTMTTAGSLALAGSLAPRDAFIVARLRQAGAVILGKANLSEWANFRSEHSSSGWSSRGGQTTNPYALDRNPCGSSSGSAVAVAANLCTVAVGTETNGSLVCPGNANGIVALKPTVGLVSRAGIIPISASQDTAGPMGRTVADVAALLGALAGIDPRDPVTEQSSERAHDDYTAFLDAAGLKGARIGVARNFFGFNPAVDEIMEAAVKRLQDLGAVIVDPAALELDAAVSSNQYTVLLHEFRDGVNRYLAVLGPAAPVHSLTEVIAYNEARAAETMPFFGQDILRKAEACGPLDSEAYVRARDDNWRLTRGEGIDAVLEQHGLDAIVAPSGGPAWLTDWVNGDHYSGGCSTPAAVAGYPHITVPAGFVHGLPVGLSFFAGAYQEPTLLRLAYAFEQATQMRREPQFLATYDPHAPRVTAP